MFCSRNGNDLLTLGQHPGQGNLSRRDIMASCNLLDPLDKGEILSQRFFLKTRETRAEVVGAEQACGAVAPGQKATAQGRERQESYSVRLAPGQYLCENVTGPERKLGLQRGKGMDLDRALQGRQIALGEANSPNLADGNQSGERTNAFFDWHLWIGAVQLVQIDDLDAQAAQRSITGGLQMCGRAIVAQGASSRISDDQATFRS